MLILRLFLLAIANLIALHHHRLYLTLDSRKQNKTKRKKIKEEKSICKEWTAELYWMIINAHELLRLWNHPPLIPRLSLSKQSGELLFLLLIEAFLIRFQFVRGSIDRHLDQQSRFIEVANDEEEKTNCLFDRGVHARVRIETNSAEVFGCDHRAVKREVEEIERMFEQTNNGNKWIASIKSKLWTWSRIWSSP